MMKVSVVIATHNEGPDLEATVALANASRYRPYEIIVWDDCSDPPVDHRRIPCVTLHRTETQWGPGKSKQLAAGAAKGDLIVVLDSHMRMPYDWLDIAIDAAQKHPRAIFCCACKGFDRGGFMAAGAEFKDNVNYDVSWCVRGKLDEIDTVPCLLGACYFYPRDVWKALDGMNSWLYGWGYEEQDISMRAWQRGFEVRRINELVVAHRFDRVPTGTKLGTWHESYNRLICLATNLQDFNEEFYLADAHPEARRRFLETRGAIMSYRQYIQSKRVLPDSAIPIKQDQGIRWRLTSRTVKPKREQAPLECLLGLEHRKAILAALPPGGKMFEWGAGGSTHWFREQGIDITSLEHDEKWAHRVGVPFVRIGHIPVATKGEELCSIPDEQNPYLLAFADQKFDVILVDGVLRNKCLEVAKRMLNPGGTIFLHDFQRDWYEEGKRGYVWEELPSCPDYSGPTLGRGKLR